MTADSHDRVPVPSAPGDHALDGMEFFRWIRIGLLLRPMNVELQLDAIGHEIARRREDARSSQAEIDAVGEAANRSASEDISDTLASQHNDMIGDLFYQSAAHSMAAVGMLAPLVETVFYRFFTSLGSMPIADRILDPVHPRSKMKATNRWDCHYHTGGKGLVTGIKELAAVTTLDKDLPEATHSFLSALFSYRNEMFHNGLEWPNDRLRHFSRQTKNDWPSDWFEVVTSDEQPWMFYMSDSFIGECLGACAGILDGMDKYLAERCQGEECREWWSERSGI